jgi:hypothetical protein
LSLGGTRALSGLTFRAPKTETNMQDENPNYSGDPEVRHVQEMLDENVQKIRKLNDDLRINRIGGAIVTTPGILGLGPSAINRIIRAITCYDGFNEDNDPYGEHDCAVMTVDGIKIIWKIDYYDLNRRFLSPDPTDVNVTSRVMTVMRADEY